MTVYPTPTTTVQRGVGFAITSLVVGCVGILMFWVYGILPILAIVFGGVSISQTKKAGQKANGMAVAGLTLGIIEMSLLVLLVIGIAAS